MKTVQIKERNKILLYHAFVATWWYVLLIKAVNGSSCNDEGLQCVTESLKKSVNNSRPFHTGNKGLHSIFMSYVPCWPVIKNCLLIMYPLGILSIRWMLQKKKRSKIFMLLIHKYIKYAFRFMVFMEKKVLPTDTRKSSTRSRRDI